MLLYLFIKITSGFYIINFKLKSKNYIKYAYTILYVENVKVTADFYEKAFGFKCKFMTPEKDYAELLSGEITIAFASIELGISNFKKEFEKVSQSKKPFGVEMAFTTEYIESDFKRAIKEGAVEFESIVEKPWGQKVGYLGDNNGFLIEICSPINT